MIPQWGQVRFEVFGEGRLSIQKSWVLLPSHKLDYFTWIDRCLSFRIFVSIQWISTCWVLWGCFPFSFSNPMSPSLQVTRSVSRGRESTGCIQGVELKGGRAWRGPISEGNCREHELRFITLTANKGIMLDLLTISLWPEIIGASSLKAHWHRTLNKVKAQRTPNSHLPEYLQFLSNPSSSPASNTLTGLCLLIYYHFLPLRVMVPFLVPGSLFAIHDLPLLGSLGILPISATLGTEIKNNRNKDYDSQEIPDYWEDKADTRGKRHHTKISRRAHLPVYKFSLKWLASSSDPIVRTVGSPEPPLKVTLNSTEFFQIQPDEPGLVSLFPTVGTLRHSHKHTRIYNSKLRRYRPSYWPNR